MTGGPAAAALEAGRTFLSHRTRDRGDRDRRVQRRDLGAQRADARRRGAAADAGDPAHARLRDAHLRRDHAVARPAARRQALLRLDRPALRRRRHRQPALTRPGGRRCREAAGTCLHGRAPLRGIRPGTASCDRRAHRRDLRRGTLGGRARRGLRAARRAARRRVPGSIPVGGATDGAGRRRDRRSPKSARRRRRTSRRRRRCCRRTIAPPSPGSCSRRGRRSS